MTISRDAKYWWKAALCAYAVLSLTSMPLMGIGSGIFLLASLAALAPPERRAAAFAAFRREPWLYATLCFFGACLLSLVVAHFAPVVSNGLRGFSELKKFHFFLYPLLIGWALGGTLGLATAAYALGIGPLVQVFLPRLTVPEAPRPAAPCEPTADTLAA